MKIFKECIHAFLSNGSQERAQHEIISTRPQVVVDLERLLEELRCLGASAFWNGGRRLATTDLEDGLKLTAVWEGMRARHHLDYQATE